MTMAVPIRNILAAVAVFVAFLVLLLASPDPSKQQAELRCDGSGLAAATFPDMATCSQDVRFKQGKCGCLRPPSEWARWYVLIVVPIMATLLGYAFLRGSLGTRL